MTLDGSVGQCDSRPTFQFTPQVLDEVEVRALSKSDSSTPNMSNHVLCARGRCQVKRGQGNTQTVAKMLEILHVIL